jgi:hypothetical protein
VSIRCMTLGICSILLSMPRQGMIVLTHLFAALAALICMVSGWLQRPHLTCLPLPERFLSGSLGSGAAFSS